MSEIVNSSPHLLHAPSQPDSLAQPSSSHNLLSRSGAIAALTSLALAFGPGAALGKQLLKHHKAPVHHQGQPVQVVETTTNLSKHLSPMPDLYLTDSSPAAQTVINFDANQKEQTIDGFGAAFTDSSDSLIYNLPPKRRAKLLQFLVTKQGLNLTFDRITLGASDFTAGRTPFSYDDMPNNQPDIGLSHFSIAHDKAYVLPVLRMVLHYNKYVKFLGSFWSPPGWMKQNGSMTDSGTGLNALVDAPWAIPDMAQYEANTVTAYANAGVKIRYLTVQNEPSVSNSYPTMQLPPNQEQAVIGQLNIDLANMPDRPYILAGDGSYDQLSYDQAVAGNGPSLPPGIRGFAVHSYFGNIGMMNQLRQEYPNAKIQEDETSPETRGEDTITEATNALNNSANSFMLWNIALNPKGGPVEPPNKGCTGCKGLVVIKNGHYRISSKGYQLGQLSDFVMPGAVKINTNNFVTTSVAPNGYPTTTSGINDAGFVNPDGEKVLVVSNTGPSKRIGVQAGKRSFTSNVPNDAVLTYTWGGVTKTRKAKSHG